MHVSALKQSKFITRADAGRGILVTIKEIFQENVAKEGAPEELKWCLGFNETEKPLVLNATNGQIIASITKQDDTDHWIGHKIVLYDDPNVSFGGKLVGGVRVRAPRAPAAAIAPTARPAGPRTPEPAAPIQEAPPEDGDEPF